MTLPIYSGCPDPVWAVDSSHKCFNAIKEHLEKAQSSPDWLRRDKMHSKLGYTGFLLHHSHTEHPHVISGPKTAVLQQALLESIPKGLVSEEMLKEIAKKFHQVPPTARSLPKKYTSGPDLSKWNKFNDISCDNNCYNYANDYITNTFAKPGRASGKPVQTMTGEAVEAAAVNDGLKVVKPAPSSTDPVPKPPPGERLVALFINPGQHQYQYQYQHHHE